MDDLLLKLYVAYINAGYCVLVAYAMALNEVGGES